MIHCQAYAFKMEVCKLLAQQTATEEPGFQAHSYYCFCFHLCTQTQLPPPSYAVWVPGQVAIVIKDIAPFHLHLLHLLHHCPHWKSAREFHAINYLARAASHAPRRAACARSCPRPSHLARLAQRARREAPQLCCAPSHRARTLAQARYPSKQGHLLPPTRLRRPPRAPAPRAPLRGTPSLEPN